MAQHQVEQRRHALVLGTLGALPPSSLPWPSVEHREIELLLVAFERRTDRTPRWRPRTAGVVAVDLLMMTIGLSRLSRALETTNLVCGSGSSAASTSTSRPSTM